MKTYIFLLAAAIFCLAALPLRAARRERRSVVRIETSEGTMRVALSDDTPLHRDNFLRLASAGAYDSTLFHRCIRDFMIQGGDPTSRHASPGELLGEGGTGYTIPAEPCLPYLYHWRGALAAAREPDEVNPRRESSGCQFYIVYGRRQSPAELKKARAMLAEQGAELTPQMADDYTMRGGAPHLDGLYTVFGEVIEGLDVVKAIQAVPTDGNDRPLSDVTVTGMYVERLSRAAAEAAWMAGEDIRISPPKYIRQ